MTSPTPKKGLSTGAMVAIIVGAVLLLVTCCCVGGVGWFILQCNTASCPGGAF